jgi:hypothetical protein
MDPCAKALLGGIIDYAGLFPPARMPMDEAFERFLRHRGEADGWMLARFVCPATRLEELEPLLTQNGPPLFPISISVLGSGGDTLEDFLTAIDHDSAAITTFSNRQTGRAVVDVFEVRLPEAGGVAVAVEKAWRRLTDGGSTPMTPYFEVSLLGDWRPRLPAAAAAVRDTDRSAGGTGRVGLKIRCGGLDAAAVPEPMAVAAAIATCRATGVPLKATQGLHHPVRHYDSKVDTMVHGFLNLFAASTLAHAHDLPVTRLAEIVAEVEPEAFAIKDGHLAWRDLEASSGQVAAARERLLTTFGSCSFAEPRDDLYQLNIIGDVS